MKLYGYKNEGLSIEEIEPQELAEITLVANPAELRKIAKFMEFTADEMEKSGKNFEHVHLSDKLPEFQNSPHFVIFNPDV